MKGMMQELLDNYASLTPEQRRVWHRDHIEVLKSYPEMRSSSLYSEGYIAGLTGRAEMTPADGSDAAQEDADCFNLGWANACLYLEQNGFEKLPDDNHE